MIRLLPKEKPIADLRLGLIQVVTEDIFARQNMVLTDKRLWLIKKRWLSSSTSVVFLRDVTTIESRRTFDILRCLLATFLILSGCSAVIGSISSLFIRPRETPVPPSVGLCIGLPFLALGVLFALNVVTNTVFVYTTMTPIQFRLAKVFSTRQLDAFVNRVQSVMSQYKR